MPKRVAVVGAGLAGLSAAYELERAAVEFDVYEASGRSGGIVKTSTRDGYIVEHGADSWIANKPWLQELAGEIGMESEVVASPAISPSTWILRGGKLLPLPQGMRLFVPGDLKAVQDSELFSAETKRRFREEAEARFEPAPAAEESVAEFAERHFGREVVEVLAGPLLAGVYGGDASRLSAEAVIPGVVEMERQHGSLIKAVQAAPGRAPAEGIFRTFGRGMQSFTDALAERIPKSRLHVGVHVIRVLRKASGYSLVTTRGAALGEEYDAVVMSVPVQSVAGMLDLALPKVEYSSAATVALGYPGTLELPAGFGFLAAQGEPGIVMAATFVHQKWPWRVPLGKAMLRAFVGDPKWLAAPDGALVLGVQDELRSVLGIRVDPEFAIVDRWPNSMPQYEIGHRAKVEHIREAVAEFGSVFLAGNAYEGVGMPDAVRSGREAGRAAAQA